MRLSKKIVINTLINGVGQILPVAISFFLIAFIIKKIGKVEYGLLVLIQIFSIGGYMSLFEFGFQSSITRAIAEYSARNKLEEIYKLINSSFLFFVLLGAVLGFINLLFVDKWILLFNIGENYINVVKLSLIVMFISYIFQFPNFVFMGVLEGLSRFDILKGVRIFYVLINAIFVVVLLSKGYRVVSIVIINTVILFLQFSTYFFFVKFSMPNFKIKSYYLSIRKIKELISVAKYSFLNRISGILFLQIDKFFVGIFLRPIYLGYYDIIFKIPRALKLLTSFGNSAVMPAAGFLYGKNHKNKLKKLFNIGIQFNIFFSLPIILFFIIKSNIFLDLWLGKDFVFLSTLVSLQLIWNLFFPLGIGWNILFGMKRRLGISTILSWSGLLLKIVGIIILIKRFKLLGLVIANVVPQIIIPILGLFVFFNEFQLNRREFFNKFMGLVVIGFLLYGIIHLIENFFLINTIFSFSVLGVMWCLSYWVLIYFFIADEEIKDILRRIFIKIINFNKKGFSQVNL